MKKTFLFIIVLLSLSKILFAQTATLTNEGGTSADININPGNTATLKVTLTGVGPWNFALFNEGMYQYYTATSSPFYITVSPTSKRRYTLTKLTTNTGNGTTTGVINVVVGTNPTLTLDNPVNLNACQGGTFEIPFTQNGYWGTDTTLAVRIVNASNTNIVVWTSGSTTNDPYGGKYSHTNPIKFEIDKYIASGTYKIQLYSKFPFVNITTSAYNITISPSSCQTQKATIFSGTSPYNCQSKTLYAYPSDEDGSLGLYYEWFKDNVSVQSSQNDYYFASSNGAYKVRVTQPSTGYDQTSEVLTLSNMASNISPSTANPLLTPCGTNISTTLSTNLVGSNYTYQWLKGGKAIIGANNSSFLATSTGIYDLYVTEGECSYSLGNTLANLPTGALRANNSASPVTITGGNSVNLSVFLGGTPPWNFQLVGTDNSVRNFTTSTSPLVIPVTPNQNTQYRVTNLSNSCGVAIASSNALQVIVSPPPSFAISGTSSFTSNGPIKQNNLNTNICPGGTIPITYSISGTWAADREMTVELLNATTNALIAGSTQMNYATNPIQYYVPLTIPVGTYKVRLMSVKPFISSPVISNTTVTVTNTACATPVATIKAVKSCSQAILTATPAGVGYSYQWLKNGNNIPNANQEIYTAFEDGDYSVAITNSTNAYSATSAVYSLLAEEINGTITKNGQICNGIGSTTLTSLNAGGNFVHQWYYSVDNIYFEPVLSAINTTLTTSNGGFYYAVIKNGNCEVKSNTIETCPINVNFGSKSACNSSPISVPFSFFGGENQSIIIQLVDATTNNIIVSNLGSLITTNTTIYNPTVFIPNTVVAGTYKFKITSGSPTNYNTIGSGILTVLNQSGAAAPTVTASLASVSSPQNVTISTTGCQFDINWNNSDGIAVSSNSFGRLISKNSTFSATCTDIYTGCISQIGSTTVIYNCTDVYEPNNSSTSAVAISLNTFTSPVICLNGFDNPDWFSWTLNGHTYYIKASLTSSQVSAGTYQLKLNYDNTNLIIETIPETIGQLLDTYLTLFDSDGVTVLSMNDNGNGNGFSKIIYELINTNPCVSTLTLNTITDDYSNGTIIKEVNATTGMITATNKITNTANVTYRAGKSITLNAGFKADNGTVFKTEFGGCN